MIIGNLVGDFVEINGFVIIIDKLFWVDYFEFYVEDVYYFLYFIVNQFLFSFKFRACWDEVGIVQFYVFCYIEKVDFFFVDKSFIGKFFVVQVVFYQVGKIFNCYFMVYIIMGLDKVMFNCICCCKWFGVELGIFFVG